VSDPKTTVLDVLRRHAASEWIATRDPRRPCDECKHSAGVHMLGRLCLSCSCKSYRNDEVPKA
jgi:hypothetical protein